MRGNLKALAILMAIVALFAFGFWGEYQVWNECRRIHPWWYCASEGGK